LKKIFVKKPGSAGLFLFAGALFRGSQRAKFLRVSIFTVCNSARMKQAGLMKVPADRSDLEGGMTGHAFERAIAAKRRTSKAFQGYPIPTNKKNRACIATYRHSGERLLENSFPPHLNVNNR
jgi:hypothetical protein